MNRNQFSLLLFLVVVVGLGGLLVYNKQNDAGKSGNAALGKKLLPNFPVNDISHIAISQGTNKLDLAKKDGTWRVRERNDYPANYNQISEFLLKAADLKIVQTEQVGPSQLGRLELLPGQGTNAALQVDFKDQNDKQLQTLLLGKKHMQKSRTPSPYGDLGDNGWPDGRYVQVGGKSGEVDVISDALANVEPKADQWLDKDFFKVDKVRTIAVQFPEQTNSWKLTRETETGEWKLADARPTEQLDSSKTSSVSNPLSSPSFNDVDTTSKPEQLGLDKPTLVSLDTFDNFTYNLKVGQKTNDNFPLLVSVAAQLPKERTPGKDEKAEDKDKLDKQFKEQQKKLQDKLAQEQAFQNWTYLVSSWTLEPLLKTRTQLLVEKKEEPKKDETKKDEKPATATSEAPKSSEAESDAAQ
ncbi:MAG TPA: DUF4340 domain-containing protein [Verrucomicrobiae bacterium]|nr:DUF4340 domain-containing protein [Verrucomicrobiae bacterium]